MTHTEHAGLERAVNIARGCYDYGGGYGGAEYEAYQHGIWTVVNVLSAALVAGADADYQLAVVEHLGSYDAMRADIEHDNAQREVIATLDASLRLAKEEVARANTTKEQLEAVCVEYRCLLSRARRLIARWAPENGAILLGDLVRVLE